MPPPTPEATAETVRSAVVAVESPMLNVRTAAPRLRLPVRRAPAGLLVSVVVRPPPRVRVPRPVESELTELAPAVAPPNVRLVTVALKSLSSRVAEPLAAVALMVSAVLLRDEEEPSLSMPASTVVVPV
jgi:hypothetical protein